MLQMHYDLQLFLKRKMCGCNPCTCPDQKKDDFFKDLKAILEMHNQEYALSHPAELEKTHSAEYLKSVHFR